MGPPSPLHSQAALFSLSFLLVRSTGSKAGGGGGWASSKTQGLGLNCFSISVSHCPLDGLQSFLPFFRQWALGQTQGIPCTRPPRKSAFQAPEATCCLSSNIGGHSGCCCLCPFQPSRDLTGCYLARHTGLKSDLQLRLFTQPGCSGGRRSRIGVIVILLCSLCPPYSQKCRQGREAIPSLAHCWQSQALQTTRASSPNSPTTRSDRSLCAWYPVPGGHTHRLGFRRFFQE